MPKAKSLAPAVSASDIAPSRTPPAAATRQRGATATEELVSLGFKLPPGFIHEFKQGALDNNMKLNEFLIYLFREIGKSGKRE
jgi:hypothetical protein